MRCCICGKPIRDPDDAIQVSTPRGWMRAHVKCIAKTEWPPRKKMRKV